MKNKRVFSSRGRSSAARAFPFGLAKVKALAHLRHDIPPTRIGQATADPLDMGVPVTASRVGVLSPQHDVKVLEGSIFGNFLFDSQVERDDVDQRTCHECPDDCGCRMPEPGNGTVFGGLSLSAQANPRVSGAPTLGAAISGTLTSWLVLDKIGQVNFLLPGRRLRGQP